MYSQKQKVKRVYLATAVTNCTSVRMAKLAGKKRSSKYSQKSAVRKALKKIRQLPRPELKYLDNYVSIAVPDGNTGSALNADNIVPIGSASAVSTSAQSSLVSPNLGNSSTTRIGQKVTVKSIQFRGCLRTNWEKYTGAGATITDRPIERVRLMLVLDKQSNGVGTAPAVADLLQEVSSVRQPDMHNKIGSAERFQTLWTHTYYITPHAAANNAVSGQIEILPQYKKVEFFKKCNLQVHYAAGSASTANDSQYVKSNNVIMVMMRDGDASQQGTITFIGSVRVRYEDC